MRLIWVVEKLWNAQETKYKWTNKRKQPQDD